MNNLADLVKERYEMPDVQVKRAVASNIQWERCKKEISQYPKVYVEKFKEILVMNPLAVKKARVGKITQITARIPGTFERYLVINEHDVEGVTAAYYVAYNNDTSTAYLRKIVWVSK